MYSTCLFCNTSLGVNDQIPTFPVGRRLAFDAAQRAVRDGAAAFDNPSLHDSVMLAGASGRRRLPAVVVARVLRTWDLFPLSPVERARLASEQTTPGHVRVLFRAATECRKRKRAGACPHSNASPECHRAGI